MERGLELWSAPVPAGTFEAESRIDAELGYWLVFMGGRAVATPHAGWSRAGGHVTLTFGQKLRLGPPERRLVSEFTDEGRTFWAGYGYCIGSALDPQPGGDEVRGGQWQRGLAGRVDNFLLKLVDMLGSICLDVHPGSATTGL